MKKSDITTEQFEAWKAEMREVFKNEPNSMNLIALGLRVLDDQTKPELHEAWNNSLLEFMQNELARKGELVCEHCGMPMEVYYIPRCFHCAEGKPKIEKYEGNYIMAVSWLENNEPEFDDDYVWDYLCDNNILRGNDTYIVLRNDNSDKRYQKNLDLLKKHFPIEDIKWLVSW
jgi:hypothetical protein